jgi:hypothetical protein
MLLQATGHAAVYVNGEVRAGDPYGLGWLRLPVLVRKGENRLLFHLAGEKLSARLAAPSSEVFFLDDDRTLPTLVRGEAENVWAAVPVVNATGKWLRDLQLECRREGGQGASTRVAPIAPLSVRKVAFQIAAEIESEGDAVDFAIRLTRAATGETPLADSRVTLRRVGPGDVHVRTFRSRIDQSVQPYAVRPAAGDPAAGDAGLPGIIVTLHDAGVDCAEQASNHVAKGWAHVVAPQGRRPFGFDWEDWGRIDALEALADARKHYPNDPRRTYLTGHGMGGHGVWHLGVSYPDQFAAIGPIAGWASFWSYGGGIPASENPNPLEAMLLRGYSPSDTVQLLSNLSAVGVYVLHGESDLSVPVAQARYMRSRLAGFHTNFAYYENSNDDLWLGDENIDWPRTMEFFERLTRPVPAERTAVDFTTANPGVSSRCDWLTIEAQQEPLKPSRAVIRQDVDTRTFVGQTTNVARLAIDVGHLPPGQPIDVALDGQAIQWINWPDDEPMLWFERTGKGWQSAQPPSPRSKGPSRNGTFKAAFDHGVILVYGTAGKEEENRWAEAKARYDAETFWYRGGGSFEVVADTDFDADRTIGRSVILYGNAESNAAWPTLLSSCPVQIRRGQVRVGQRTVAGDDLAVLMIYPRADSEAATVGVVAGTGSIGSALTNRCRYFISGTAYPDLAIVGGDVLVDGPRAIRAWGYFGPDWSVDFGATAWSDDGR